MARSNNLPSKNHMAGERTETTLKFIWDAGSSSSTVYIDIAKALSQLNRRFYRQGLYYYVASAQFSNGSTCYVQLNTLPDTWMTKLAWKRGFQQWSKMNRLAAQPDSIYPKYHDFKVALHNSATTTLNVTYGDVDSSSAYSSDDWELSEFVTMDPTMTDTGDYQQQDDDDPDKFLAHMLGPHAGSDGAWTSIGLIHSLNNVWRRDDTAGVPTLDAEADTDPIANLFDAADNFDDIRLNLDTDNDEPPYNHDVMTGSASIHEHVCKQVMRTGTGAGALARSGGFCVPFGLMHVQVDDFGTAGDIGLVELELNMVPGTYHGVHAERVI